MTDKWTIYRTDTGEITGVLESPDPETVALNVGEGEAAIPGDWQPGDYYVADGEPQPLPPKPGPWAVWTAGGWHDPRTPADLEAELENRRAATSLDKTDFIMRALQFGIITENEARDISKSLIPERFQIVFDQIPAQFRLEAEIRWSASKLIQRTNPVILMLAQAMGITTEELDLLFDVSDN